MSNATDTTFANSAPAASDTTLAVTPPVKPRFAP